MVDDFYLLGVLPRGINSSFITLIPRWLALMILKISYLSVLLEASTKSS